MVFTRLLVSTITVSMVLVQINTVPTDLTYTQESIDSGSKNSTTLISKIDNLSDDSDRESNLKYVMAIKNSSMWKEIKRRSLTISTEPHSKSLVEKVTENLTDQELSQLKQVCQDGLKCVAVDQLSILKQAKQTADGKTEVRKAIMKITSVITDYTNEYHEEKYRYEAVTDADDTDKMDESVMTIMEDNKELCQIDPNTSSITSTSSYTMARSSLDISSAESSNKSSDSSYNQSFDSSSNQSSDSSLTENSDSSDKQDSALVKIVNYGHVNFGEVNQYNVNESTTNSATVNLAPSSDDSSESSEEPNPPPTIKASTDRPTEQRNLAATINTSSTIDPSSTLRSERLVGERQGKAQYLKKIDGEQKQNVSNNKIPESDSLPVKTVSPDQTAASTDTDSSTSCSTCANAGTSTPTDAVAPAETDESSADTDTNDNFLNMGNGENSAFGKNYSLTDIASAGSNNQGVVNKGYVEDGNLNNGMMKIMNINRGTINKGIINNSTAENGIINVGTVNNGETNYGKVNTYTDNSRESETRNYDVQLFAGNLEKMYSDIYDNLSKQL